MEADKRFPTTNSKVFKLICESLVEMRQTQGVPAHQVCDVVCRKYDGRGSPPSTREVRIALERGVQDGYLCYNNRRYNLETYRCRCCKCPPKPKPGLIKRIKNYFNKMMKKKCKLRKKKSKKCKRGHRRKAKSSSRRKSREKRKRSKSRCGC